MPQIVTRRVGRTGIPVTSVGMGTAQLGGGGIYELVPEAQGRDTVLRALALGIRLVDTAPFYGAGIAEERLGEILKEVDPSMVTLATKVGRLVVGPGKVAFDFSRDGVMRSVEESLRRLDVDHLDIVHIHDPDNHVEEALNEAFRTLADLRDQGVIGAIGVGMTQWQVPLQFVRETSIDCLVLAGRYTLLEQTGALDTLFPECERRNVSVMLGGIYNSGILATGAGPNARYEYRSAPPDVLQRVERLSETCERHGVPLQVAAVQFPLAHPAVTSIMVGMISVAEVAALERALVWNVPAALWAELREEGLIDPLAPVPA